MKQVRCERVRVCGHVRDREIRGQFHKHVYTQLLRPQIQKAEKAA